MREVLLLLALAQAAPDSPVRTLAKALSTPRPRYPREALRSGVEGTVMVEFVIDTTGRVSEARAAEPLPWLDEAAVEAVKRWSFEPARQGDTPVSTRGRAPVEFRLAREKADAPASPRARLAPPPDLDLAAVVKHADGAEELPVVRGDAGICSAVELTSPALRLARFVRRARVDGTTLRPADLERQAEGTLAVYFEPKLNWVTGGSVKTGIGPPVRGATVQTCPVEAAKRVALRSAGGAILEPLNEILLASRVPAGEKRPVLDAVALFDLEQVRRLGAPLEVVAEFSRGKPQTAAFDAEALRTLFPAWSMRTAVVGDPAGR